MLTVCSICLHKARQDSGHPEFALLGAMMLISVCFFYSYLIKSLCGMAVQQRGD